MRQNLEQRNGLYVPGLQEHRNVSAQQTRFTENGWQFAKSCSMMTFYQHVVSTYQKRYINRVEMLDEVEEWFMLMEHYVLTASVLYIAGQEQSSMATVIPTS